MDIIGAICYYLGFAVIKTGSFAAKIMSFTWRFFGSCFVSCAQSRAANYANNHK